MPLKGEAKKLYQREYMRLYMRRLRDTVKPTKPDSVDISPDRKCQVCGYFGVHDTHHVDKNTDNNIPENRITLCPTCHAEVHRRGKELNITPVKTPDPVRRYPIIPSVHFLYKPDLDADGNIIHDY